MHHLLLGAGATALGTPWRGGETRSQCLGTSLFECCSWPVRDEHWWRCYLWGEHNHLAPHVRSHEKSSALLLTQPKTPWYSWLSSKPWLYPNH